MVFFFKDGDIPLQQYLEFDDSTVLYYIGEWCKELDPIFSDLCQRFLHRRLFKYVQYDPNDYRTWADLQDLFLNQGLDPRYYLELDSPSDLPYDFYRMGHEEEEKLPILLEMPDGSLEELSSQSIIVKAISGKRRFDHKLYFPDDLVTEEIRSRLRGN